MSAADPKPIDVLRAATRDIHQRIDSGGFAQGVLDGSLTVAQYGSFLRAVYLVHCALEEEVERAGDAALREAYLHGVARRQRLADDLAYLRIDPNGVDGAALHALVLGQRLRADAREGGARVFGHLYVLEGSQLGGLFQKRALEQRPELAGGGLAYLSGAGRETQAQFRAFLDKLDVALSAEADVASAVIGATHAFAAFESIVKAVIAPDERWLTAPLNLDAGTHPIPKDVRELQAALRAGERSFQDWAYYEARYGERGVRFTRSDSAWLITLAREDQKLATRHVRWLSGVLTARGMPTLLMEQHLEALHAALLEWVPEFSAEYVPLQRAAHRLRAEREAVLDDAQLESLAHSFQVKPELLRPHEAGLLIVAAVLDEKRGARKAVESLLAWLRDPARFSPAWCAAVDHTLAEARAAC